MLAASFSGAAMADDATTYKVGVAIYDYNDNFMTLYRNEIESYFATLETDDPHGVAKIDPVYKISARLENKVDYDRFMAIFGPRTDIEITSSFKDNYEISAKGVNKGTAVAALAEILGISEDKIGVIGDYYNDWDMLLSVKHSACPKQAPQDIHEICEFHACHCNEGAVADFLAYIENTY